MNAPTTPPEPVLLLHYLPPYLPPMSDHRLALAKPADAPAKQQPKAAAEEQKTAGGRWWPALG